MGKDKKQELSSYEDNYDLIRTEVRKRRGKWFLTSVAWMDFDDVTQIILMHIYKKWHQWDQSRPLKPWINKVITNQLKNILRNNYSNFMRPCLSCPFNLSGDGTDESLCGFTKSGLQDGSCPLFKKWERTKKAAYDIKMAVSLDAATHETIMATSVVGSDITVAEEKLHEEMKKQLGDRQFKVYEMLFIKNIDETEVARIMGYKTTESGRRAGYKQIKNLKKKFKDQAKLILQNKDIFIYGRSI